MPSLVAEIERTRVIAIVRLMRYDRALEIVQALVKGGISVIEFTLTGQGAFDAIAQAHAVHGDTAFIGVGTVLRAEDVATAAAAGAQFVVTPLLSRSVIDACRSRALPVVCGALTPTEMMQAYEAGADFIKLFPARQMGPQYVRDVLAPLPHLRLVPTGGVNAQNAAAYLQAGASAVGIGGNLVSEQTVAAGDWEKITSLARECRDATRL